MAYVGRFAPSPTGPLHAGSLLTAVASFLHARRAGGEWLVRIEDIDSPREVPGAAGDILRTLEGMDLHWDRPVLYQSTRVDAYSDAVADLLRNGLAFRCSCSRSELRALAVRHGAAMGYPGTCRSGARREGPTAVRMRVEGSWEPFEDGLQKTVCPPMPDGFGDYVIWRRDGLPAYHLAVVVDDGFQGITTIVRGSDLLDSVPAQRHLQHALGLPRPRYFHLPIVTTATGEKLSKQSGAVPVDLDDRSNAALRVLSRLGLDVPVELRGASPRVLWEWAVTRWSVERLRGMTAIADAPATGTRAV